ncbi:hypothetical protein D3C87_2014440 [compost metagenome]
MLGRHLVVVRALADAMLHLGAFAVERAGSKKPDDVESVHEFREQFLVALP